MSPSLNRGEVGGGGDLTLYYTFCVVREDKWKPGAMFRWSNTHLSPLKNKTNCASVGLLYTLCSFCAITGITFWGYTSQSIPKSKRRRKKGGKLTYTSHAIFCLFVCCKVLQIQCNMRESTVNSIHLLPLCALKWVFLCVCFLNNDVGSLACFWPQKRKTVEVKTLN